MTLKEIDKIIEKHEKALKVLHEARREFINKNNLNKKEK